MNTYTATKQESDESLLDLLGSPTHETDSTYSCCHSSCISESDEKLEVQLLIKELMGYDGSFPIQQQKPRWFQKCQSIMGQKTQAQQQQLKFPIHQQSVYRQQLQQQQYQCAAPIYQQQQQQQQQQHHQQQRQQQQQQQHRHQQYKQEPKSTFFHKIEQDHQADEQVLEEFFRPPLLTSISPLSFSEDSSESLRRQPVTLDRETEIQEMADYITKVVEKGNRTTPDGMSSKLKVHEVILAILLNDKCGDRTKDLRRILTFCDKEGCEVSEEGTHFKTLDTETMGLLWQKIKKNKQSNYDTFARAMRVRREKSSGFFGYMESGKRSKKRIYKLGDKAVEEMVRMKKTLSHFSGVRHGHGI